MNFFYDDIAVPNEASSGAVALLKLYNYALDSTVIREKWDQLGSSVFGLNETSKSNVKINVYPNPVSDILNLNLSALSNQGEARIQIVNEIGQVVLVENIVVNSSSYSLAVNHFKKGLYTVLIETNGEIARTKFIVN